MTDDPDDPSLIALGAAVADGVPVDWLEAESHADSPDRQYLIRGLRDVAALVAAHRDVSDSGTSQPAAVSPHHWRHLVLFEAVGKGAFGTVYRGWDPRVERQVAVKLLRKADHNGPAPLAEARHLARVRHSNIVIVHGADQDDEQVGIWMEYIDGQTLAAMIRDDGPMSAREVAGIGLDLCRALSALHAAGLLHRDLKAQNVMREVGGRIVLMDFSGAQALAAEADEQVFSGTPLYMAPELFDGRPATVASDIYSLGVLLFFLLTGTVPVDGPTLAALKTSHSRRARKRLRDLRPDLAETIVQVIGSATDHDPDKRYQTVGELEHALTAASGGHRSPAAVTDAGQLRIDLPRVRAQRWTAGLWAAAAVVVVLGLLAAAGLLRWREPAPPAIAARFSIEPPYVTGSWPRLSPDGHFIVFGTFIEGRRRFWIRPLDSEEGRVLMNTTASETPFWSPDSRTLAFFEDGKLKKIAAGGGEPETLTNAEQPKGGDWKDGLIIFGTRNGLFTIAPDGSQLAAIKGTGEAGESYGWPRFLPDGRHFLYLLRSPNRNRTGIYVGSLEGDPPRRLMPAYSRVTYSGNYLFYVRDGTLLAQPFDSRRAIPSGSPISLFGRVKYHAEGDAAFDVAPSGVMIYFLEPGQASTRLMLFDRRGRQQQGLTEVGAYRHPRFSPDGGRVVAEKASLGDSNVDVWIYEVARQSAVKLTSPETPEVHPVWSPDGKRVVFSSKRNSLYRIYTQRVDGTQAEEPLARSPADAVVEHWSHDGRYLSTAVLGNGLWIIPFARAEKPWLVQKDPRASIWQSEFSPDGKWIAYMSGLTGSPEVFVEPLPATGERFQISPRGGSEPHWRADGQELFYLDGESTLMAIDTVSPGWQNSKPTPLFRVKVPDLAGHSAYDVSPDGQTFVVNVFIADPLVPPLDVVLNWQSLLGK